MSSGWLLSATLADLTSFFPFFSGVAKALGAIATPECLAPLKAFQDDPTSREVAQTCQLALQRIERGMSEVRRE